MERRARINEKMQLTLTKEEIDNLGVRPGDDVRVWTKDGLTGIVIYKPDKDEKDAVASRQ